MADALDRLARLRAIEERGAKLELARCLRAEAAAEAEARAAARAIAAEAAGDPQTFGRWLPRGLDLRDQRAAEAARAADRSQAARAALAGAHSARAVVEEAVAERRAMLEYERQRRVQSALDDLVQRRRGQTFLAEGDAWPAATDAACPERA